MKKILSLTLVLMLLTGLLAGCGAASKGAGIYDSITNEMAMAAPMEPMAPMAEEMGIAQDNSLAQSESDTSAAIPENRKWIITVNISAETEDLDALMDAVNERIAALKGYVEAQNVYNGSNYSSRRYRNASLTVRIPADSVDQFTADMAGISNVVRSNKNLEDITLTYTATESRVKALQTEEARLLELMAKAETMSDLLEIEARLTDVRYELERATTRLKGYDNKVDYATVYLELEEVQEYTPVEEETLWQRISGGFVSSLKGVGEGIVNFIVWIIVSSPYLLVFGGIAYVIVRLARKHRKPRISKKQQAVPPAQPEKTEE